MWMGKTVEARGIERVQTKQSEWRRRIALFRIFIIEVHLRLHRTVPSQNCLPTCSTLHIARVWSYGAILKQSNLSFLWNRHCIMHPETKLARPQTNFTVRKVTQQRGRLKLLIAKDGFCCLSLLRVNFSYWAASQISGLSRGFVFHLL